MTAPSADAAVIAKSKLSKLADKRLVRFVTLFPKALVKDSPGTIHDLRVASRRLQQVLQLLSTKSKSAGAKKLLRTLRKVRRAFGPCRNLDASIEVIKGRIETSTAASTREGWEEVRSWLEQKRAAALETGRAELRKHDLVSFIERIQARLENAEEEGQAAAQLWERTRDALKEWKAALESAKAEPELEHIHAFRIAGKRLRYRAESLRDLGGVSLKPIVAALKNLQDDLGNWHDHSVAREHVAEFIGRNGLMAREPGMCRALLLEMDREKQRDQAIIAEITSKAEKLAENWTESLFDSSDAESARKDQ